MTGRSARHVKVPRQELHRPSSELDRLARQGARAQDALERKVGFLPCRREREVGRRQVVDRPQELVVGFGLVDHLCRGEDGRQAKRSRGCDKCGEDYGHRSALSLSWSC